MAWSELGGMFPEFPGSSRWVPLLQRHLELVLAASPRVRVTAVAPGEMVRRQYAESLELWRIVLAEPGEAVGLVVDVGSGGGFPGLVMAIAAPETRFVLVEALRKRARLLEELSAELAVTNVTVVAVRAEAAGRGPLRDGAAVVVARAVAPLAELLEYTAPLCAPGGLLALPRSSSAGAELEEAARALDALGCQAIGTRPMRDAINELTRVVLVRKTAPTPAAYPRRPGTPASRPLK